MFLDNIFKNIMLINEIKRQSIATFINQIVFTFIGFLSTMYFAHALGSSVLGIYFLFTAYFGIINLVSDGGFGGAAIKRISEGEEQDSYFSAFFAIRAIFTLVVISLIFAFKVLIGANEQILDWLVLALIVSFLHSIMSNGIAGRSKMGIVAAGKLTQNISKILVQVVAVIFGFKVGGLIGGFVVSFIVASLLLFRFFDLKLVKFKLHHVSNLVSFSFWLFLTSAGGIIYSYADVIMVGYFLGESDVGVYRVVFQFTSIAVILATALRTTLWPKVSRWGKTGDMFSAEKALSHSLTFSLLMAIPIASGGILLGEKMLYFFYGSDFIGGYNALVILFFAQLVIVFQTIFVMFLGALDRQRYAFYVTATSTIVNIILNFILIPILGIAGAAAATFFSMLLNTFLAMSILSNVISIKIEIKSFFSILKATLVMLFFVAIYIYVVSLTNVWLLLFPVFIGGIIYTFLILRIDSAIHKDVKDIFTLMNLPWSKKF